MIGWQTFSCGFSGDEGRRAVGASDGVQLCDWGIRKAAVFALSQRPRAESVPILMELVKTSDFGDVRRSALFWLA